ncbi:MAG: NUDIX hydrolase [Alphaproteobacteria bacterium]|nr:MAG: NUDIX hydrolase [Alphaproteobacteria bacterium]
MTGTAEEKTFDRQDLATEIKNYTTTDAKERAHINAFLTLLENPRCFYRDCFPAHITGSAILLNVKGDKILMNHHKSLNKWLFFGGHADGEEDVLSVAIRETMEESGITALKPISPDFIDIDIHEIPANDKKKEPAHSHYDMRYIMQMTEEQPPVISNESTRLEWMDFDNALSLALDDDPGMKRLLNKACHIASIPIK